MAHIIDIVPTFMEIAGASYPERINGRKTKPIAGKSLLPIFQGGQRRGHDVLYWQFGRAKAVRAGRWKLVSLGNSGWELYDLEEDRTELHNLASHYPERVKQMAAQWDTWWKTCRG